MNKDRLGDKVKTMSGATPLSTIEEYYKNGDIPWINSGEIGQYKINKTKNFITQKGYENSNTKLVPKGSLLIAMYGATAGRTSLLNIDRATTNQAICAITPTKGISNTFLKYKLDHLYEYLVGISSGSARDNLSQKVIQDLEINLPSFPTQQKIASILSALDNKIELNNQINAELEAMAKTIYDYWFVQFDFPFDYAQGSAFDFAQGSAFDYAQGSATNLGTEALEVPYKSSGGRMVWNEELKREIPGGWEVMTIGELGTITGGSTPSKKRRDFFTKDGIPWITPKDLSLNTGKKFITKGGIDITEKGLKSASLRILPPYSVLMSSRAPVGYLAINREECTTNQGFKSVVCNKGYPVEYVYYTLKYYMPYIEANASGSTFKEISTRSFQGIQIGKPSTELILKFNEKITPIVKKQNNLELQNRELATLRDWLLPMLMNGQVSVGNKNYKAVSPTETVQMQAAEEQEAYKNQIE